MTTRITRSCVRPPKRCTPLEQRKIRSRLARQNRAMDMSRTRRRQEEHHERALHDHLARDRQTPARSACVMREVPIAPQRLRKSKQHAQERPERLVRETMAKERAMDEVMRDRVRVPPHAEGDE